MLVLLLSIFLTVAPSAPGEAAPDPEVQVEESVEESISEEELIPDESGSVARFHYRGTPRGRSPGSPRFMGPHHYVAEN